MLIEFTQYYVVQDEHRTGPNRTVYQVGDTLDVPESSALHFLNRNVAVIAEPDKEKEVLIEEVEVKSEKVAVEVSDYEPTGVNP